jgi:hypothetical protein
VTDSVTTAEERGFETSREQTQRERADHAHGGVLPSLRTDLSPEEVVTALDRASRRGRLPGFEALEGAGRFSAIAFGEPFDRALIGEARREGDRTRVSFRLRALLRMPLVALAIIAVTIWPGVWLMDSLLVTYFSWYPRAGWVTPSWYLPLTVLPLAWWAPRTWRRSARAAEASARETIERIRVETGAEVVRGE